MSIAKKTKQVESVTEPWRAIELFTNRHEATRLFCQRLHSEPTPEDILFFTGDGGNGKSLLLAYLRKYFCILIPADDWQRLSREASNQHVCQTIIQHRKASSVPSALIDFDIQNAGEERPQEAFYALSMLRRQLAGNALKFPRYTLASVKYLLKTNQAVTKERLRELYPDEELGLVLNLWEAFGASGTVLSVGKGLLSLFNKHLGRDVVLALHKREIDQESVEAIERMETGELQAKLPQFFAEDLSASMTLAKAPRRLVLFFDTHEAFWGKERDIAGDLYYRRDEWLRALLVHLELSAGILIVIAGREAPRWGDRGCTYRIPVEDTPNEKSCLLVHPVNNLTQSDADDYLVRAGIRDEAMRNCLSNYALVAPNEIHPFFLGLCADIVLAAEARNESLVPQDFANVPEREAKAHRLTARLLRYVDENVRHAVCALSACRVFDRELYNALGTALNFHASRADFDRLTRFSFVWRLDREGKTRYRIHDLLRKLFREQSATGMHTEPGSDLDASTVTKEADAFLAAHYGQQFESGNSPAIVEAIYHTNQLDTAKGIDLWLKVQEAALQRSQYDLCEALHTLRRDLSNPDEFSRGLLAAADGDYAAVLARYRAARSEFDAAIEAYDEALKRAPDDSQILNNKGTVLAKLGDLQTSQAQHPEALGSYQAAIVAYDEALKRAPDYIYAYNNKGTVLAKLGDLQTNQAQHPEALGSYQAAIVAYDEALKRAPDYIYAYNNKGSVLQSLGDLQTSQSQYPEALGSYQAAIVAFDESLRRAPNDVRVQQIRNAVNQLVEDITKPPTP